MRLDEKVFTQFNLKSRTKAKDLITLGKIKLKGEVCKKPSQRVTDNDEITLEETFSYCSKGGDKLKKGIDAFHFSVSGKTFVDVGASSGGFSHVLLEACAKKVYCVDIGENQLEDVVKNDERVVVLDSTNARDLSPDMFAESELFVVSDLSFISLTLVIPAISKFAKEMILLVKPQFECGRHALNKKGIVKDPKEWQNAIDKVSSSAKEHGFSQNGIVTIDRGREKNREFVILYSKEIELKKSN